MDGRRVVETDERGGIILRSDTNSDFQRWFYDPELNVIENLHTGKYLTITDHNENQLTTD